MQCSPPAIPSRTSFSICMVASWSLSQEVNRGRGHVRGFTLTVYHVAQTGIAVMASQHMPSVQICPHVHVSMFFQSFLQAGGSKGRLLVSLPMKTCPWRYTESGNTQHHT
eukprot:1160495-Pelagomonas_calceolata.AAC.12